MAHAEALAALEVEASPLEPVTVAQVRAVLRPDEALLSYAADSVLVVTPSAEHDVRLPAGPTDTWSAVGPAVAALPPGITRLTVVPHGPLATAPLAALAPDGGPPILDRFAVSLVPSATHLVALRGVPARQGDDQVLVVADPIPPAWEAPVAPLPHARAEASAIAARFGQRASTRLGRGASEGALLFLSPEYSLLHVAARGVSAPDRAVVLLAADDNGDGLLTAWEVVDHGLDRPVVVLADVASVEPAGPWPLARAWLEAGAVAVVMSLPGTEPSTEVVQEVHRRFAAGADVATAVAEAQRRARANGVDWVGLVAIGDGAAVPFAGGVPEWPSAWLWWGTLGVLGVVLGAGVLAGRAARRRR